MYNESNDCMAMQISEEKPFRNIKDNILEQEKTIEEIKMNVYQIANFLNNTSRALEDCTRKCPDSMMENLESNNASLAEVIGVIHQIKRYLGCD